MAAASRNLAWLAKHHFATVRGVSFVLCLCPALWLAAEWLSGTLGINPLNRLLHFTGRSALVMLTITLAVTPARRLSVLVSKRVHALYGKRVSDWNWLIRLRRQFGLYTFFYAGLHGLVYLWFDAGLDWRAMRDDALERPFILLGLAAFTLLLPLAATSNQAAMRTLGRGWRRLHMLSYLVAILAALHFWAIVKVGDWRPLPDTVALALLLALRLHAWRLGDRSPAVEVKERQGVA